MGGLFTFKAFGVLTFLVLIPLFKIRVSRHFIVILLSLEVFRLVAMLAFRLFSLRSIGATSFILTGFTVFVCEACLGLGVLINSSRVFGRDYIAILF